MVSLAQRDQQESLDLQVLLDATATKAQSAVLDSLVYRAQ